MKKVLLLLLFLPVFALAYPLPKNARPEPLFVYGDEFYDELTGGWLVVTDSSNGPQIDENGNIIGEPYYYCCPNCNDDGSEDRHNPDVPYPQIRVHSEVKAGRGR